MSSQESVRENEMDYGRFVLLQMQLSGCCARFERACSNAEGMRRTGLTFAACVSARRAVREAVDAALIKDGRLLWLDSLSTATNLELVAKSDRYDYLKPAIGMESLPTDASEAVANDYVERCLHFALETVGIRRLGVPTGPRFSDEGREPRYAFVRRWGSEALGMGIRPTKYPEQLLIATIRGGRGVKVAEGGS
jgi:hypothetical protein